jgi:hypothetical protein
MHTKKTYDDTRDMHEEDRVSREEFDARMRTCNACPSFLRGLEFEGVTYDACGECLCPIVMKAAAAAQECPTDRWGKP